MVELYPIPPVAERDVRLILLLNVFQSALESAPTVVEEERLRLSSCPERVRPFAMPRVSGACASHERTERVHDRVVTLVSRRLRDPEIDDISLRTPATVPESERSSEVREDILVVRVETFPDRVPRVVSRILIAPERVVICDEWIRLVPERVSTVDERLLSDPERVPY